MKKLLVFLWTVVFILGVVGPVTATLHDRGGGLIYDDVPEQDREKLEILHELEYVTTECMKKILDDKIYLIYSNDKQKERYFN